MPSTYSPPDVLVTQNRVSNSAPQVTPPLPACLIGPAYQIATREAAGSYEAGTELVAGFPSIIAGAIVDPASISVALSAADVAGNDLGVFPLTNGTDYSVVTDVSTSAPTGLRLFGTFGLSYSLLSYRNNDMDAANNDGAVGQASVLTFTDTDVDFLALAGFQNDGTEYLQISSPATLAGSYRINGVSQALGVASTLSVEAVTFAGASMVPVLDQYTATTGVIIGAGGAQRIKGAPTSHQYASTGPVVANTVTSVTRGNATAIAATADTFGVGIKSVVMALGNTGADAFIGASLPANGSGAAVWAQPTSTVDVNWLALIAAAKAGHWLRLKFLAIPALRDFLVVAVDSVNKRLQLQDPFAPASTATTTPVTDATILSDGWLLEVFKGSSDGINVAGDVVVNTTLNATIEIVAASPIHIDLASPFPAAASGTVWQVKRGLALKYTDATYDIRKNLSTGFTGTPLVSYKALRTDITDPLVVSSVNDIETYVGVINPENPLAFALNLALAASGSTGMVVYALATPGTGVTAYQSALEVAQGRENLYYLVPLTEDAEIVSLCKAHADAMSTPKAKGWRRVFASSILPTFDPVWPAVATDDAISVAVTTDGSSGRIKITEVNPAVPVVAWDRIKVGNLVWLTNTASGAKSTAYRVKQVNPVQQYALLFTAIPGATSTEYVRIETAPRTKLQQAEAWRDEAAAYASERLSLVRPDRFTATYTDPVTATDKRVVVEGFYAAAALAGLRSSLAPQQPMTNMGLPGVGELFHSNSYFTADQLNTIAEGGNLLLTQRLPTAPALIRHQLTTNMDSIEQREMSIGIAVDYASIVFRAALSPYIGKHNITKEFLTQLRAVAEATTNALVTAGVLRRGSRVVSLSQNADRPDEIDMEVSMLVHYPCNRINVKLTY